MGKNRGKPHAASATSKPSAYRPSRMPTRPRSTSSRRRASRSSSTRPAAPTSPMHSTDHKPGGRRAHHATHRVAYPSPLPRKRLRQPSGPGLSPCLLSFTAGRIDLSWRNRGGCGRRHHHVHKDRRLRSDRNRARRRRFQSAFPYRLEDSMPLVRFGTCLVERKSLAHRESSACPWRSIVDRGRELDLGQGPHIAGAAFLGQGDRGKA